MAELVGRPSIAPGFGDSGPSLVLAHDALEHRIRLFGGPPVDLGSTIDWHRDPIGEHSWSRGYSGDQVLLDPSHPGDVRVVWEVGRSHHILWLAVAYQQTGDDRWAGAVAESLDSWLRGNPCLGSVHWANAMEPAIRVVNHLVAVGLVRESPAVDHSLRRRLLASWLETGRFISNHLERIPGRLATNHLIADFVGLLHLGLLAPWFAESRHWARVGREGLLGQLSEQFFSDGVHHEASTGYQRLVVEMYLVARNLCAGHGIPFESEADDRVVAMVGALADATGPDGRMARFGDLDGGRLLPWSPVASDDGRSVLDLAATVYPTRGFRPSSRVLVEGGWAFLRRDGAFLAIRVSHPVVVRGHLHNDLLSFEFDDGRTRWVEDPGTYSYGVSPAWRDRFRSSRSHAVVVVDGQEMNPLPADAFDLPRVAQGEVLEWIPDEGFLRAILVGPWTHRRSFRLLDGGRLRVDDEVDPGRGAVIEAFLPLAPGIRVDPVDGSSVDLEVDGRRRRLALVDSSHPVEMRLAEGWSAPTYGRRTTAPRVELSMTVEGGPAEWTWLLE